MATTHQRNTIELSHDTKASLAELQKLYDQNKVFHGRTATLQDNAELQKLLPRVFVSLAKDIKSHARITDASFVHDPVVLYNMKVRVGVRHGCFVTVGIWDTETQTCYYDGEYRISGCYEA
jgi:hypothetical protein